MKKLILIFVLMMFLVPSFSAIEDNLDLLRNDDSNLSEPFQNQIS